MADIDEVIECLRTYKIAAIHDNHRSPVNRQLVFDLITHKDRPVKAFFFEWQRDDGLNTTLASMPFSRVKKNLPRIREDLAGYFMGAAHDAEPGIPELVATAAANDIISIASDANYDQIVENDLEGNRHWLFQLTGLAARDKAAAAFIAQNITFSRIGNGRLLLWGSGHFTENVSHSDCLHQCLTAQGLSVKVFE